ncbi:MAG: rhomboid family intramembrane serine protease [Caldisericaceae bacterium]|nr:rhomboid family intramembrane serine protease [Caldisericaceae bacterium]
MHDSGSYYRFRSGGMLPPAVKNLMFANGIIWLMMILNGSLRYFLLDQFALNRIDVFYNFKIWQLVTYMFLHDPSGFMHVFFNMLFLWMFGAELENEWGTKEFLKYYFITGIGAGILNIILSPSPTIGASGAVYGIMLAYALRYPDRYIYIYFLFPVKIKYFMAFLAFVSFFSTFGAYGGGIAHAAHLGGIVIGYIYLKYWYMFYKIKSWLSSLSATTKTPKMKYRPGGKGSEEEKVEYYRKVIDELLDKINRVGYLNLTEEEKKLLEEGSNYLREHDKENYH